MAAKKQNDEVVSLTDEYWTYYDPEHPDRKLREIYGRMSKAKRKQEMEDLIRFETEASYGSRENFDLLLKEGKVKGKRSDYNKFPYVSSGWVERYPPDSNGQRLPKMRIQIGLVAPGRVELFSQILVTKLFAFRGEPHPRMFRYWTIDGLLVEKESDDFPRFNYHKEIYGLDIDVPPDFNGDILFAR